MTDALNGPSRQRVRGWIYAVRVLGRMTVARMRIGREGAAQVAREEIAAMDRAFDEAKHDILDWQLRRVGVLPQMQGKTVCEDGPLDQGEHVADRWRDLRALAALDQAIMAAHVTDGMVSLPIEQWETVLAHVRRLA